MLPEVRQVNFEEMAMTAETIRRQVNLIQEVMERVMQKDVHYGVIPGCGTKPTLLKPGAEKLSTTFRFAPSYKITKTEAPGGHREYEIICTLTHITTSLIVGQGVGSCSTMEGKYRFRNSDRVCPECSKSGTIIKGREEYGGGWICFAKKGGCGAKWKDGDKAIESQQPGKEEHDNPADYYNTVLKMAKKRAHVDAVLTATAASDIFTQDIEDMPEVFGSHPAPANTSPLKTEKKVDPDISTKKQQGVIFNLGKDAGLSTEQTIKLVMFFKEGEKLMAKEADELIENFPQVLANWKEVST